MKCPNCSKENNYDALYCLYCGSQLATQPQTTAWGNKIIEAIKSKLFLALCILMTVSTACLALSFSFNIIGILATIFLWILYSNTKKGTTSSKDLRNISGTIYASYVIDYILAGFMFLLGIAFLFIAIFASNNAMVLETFEDALASAPQLEQLLPYQLTAQIVLVFIWVFAILFLFMAVVTIIINVFGIRHIHRTVKLSYQSMDNPIVDPTKYANSARVWMWIFGVFTILSGLSTIVSTGFLAGVSGTCQGVVYILGAILVNNCLLKSQPVQIESEPIQETIE